MGHLGGGYQVTVMDGVEGSPHHADAALTQSRAFTCD
jgi:hypothetical protein